MITDADIITEDTAPIFPYYVDPLVMSYGFIENIEQFTLPAQGALLKTLEERDKAIAGTKKEAEVSEIELQKKLLHYENRINEAKAKAYEERLRIRQQGLDKEREIIENARKDAQDSLLQAKTKLGQDVVTILARLKQESKIISKGIAEKILDRKVA